MSSFVNNGGSVTQIHGNYTYLGKIDIDINSEEITNTKTLDSKIYVPNDIHHLRIVSSIESGSFKSTTSSSKSVFIALYFCSAYSSLGSSPYILYRTIPYNNDDTASAIKKDIYDFTTTTYFDNKYCLQISSTATTIALDSDNNFYLNYYVRNNSYMQNYGYVIGTCYLYGID